MGLPPAIAFLVSPKKKNLYYVPRKLRDAAAPEPPPAAPGQSSSTSGSGTELAVDGLVDEGAQPGAEVEVPLGAEALEPLTGFGKDADMNRYTVQHKGKQQHIEQQSGYNATWRHTHPP